MPTPMLGNMGKNWLVRRLQQWHNALRGLRKLRIQLLPNQGHPRT